jgi:hypothetical protein
MEGQSCDAGNEDQEFQESTGEQNEAMVSILPARLKSKKLIQRAG